MYNKVNQVLEDNMEDSFTICAETDYIRKDLYTSL